ncbi:hypothetical protein MMYC01_202486 [Madurella mycetomatis]|uniref:Uncharacterized protein n=1 Tax=Madurella mycetomatis TaxID=100816 RepID=A0A175WCZ2_9PEZI|nr:hypothetical protein MMYC01_202486 [Madurella mycetomatis]
MAINLPLLGVFHVVRQDTVTLLTHLSSVLDQISAGSMDERLMQNQLTHWRTLLHRSQRELRALATSLSDFFLFPYQDSTLTTLPPRLTASLSDLQAEIKAMAER